MTTKSARKILVIDDDTVILDFLIEILQDEISVSYSSDGAKAVELGKQHKPDLILLDVMMPGIDGFEVCKLLKADPDTQQVPIIFLTGKADEKDIARGLELGAIDYITKPFDPDITVAKIRNILKQINATRAAANPVGQESSGQRETRERRAGGDSRPDRIPKDAPQSDVMERRAHGAGRPDRFPKPAEMPQGISLTKFLVIALLVAIVGGGGYAWYSNAPATDTGASDSTAKTEPAAPAPTRNTPNNTQGLSEEDISSVIAEPDDQMQKDPQAPASGSSTQSCDELPKVPWWGNASHDSITNYVINKSDGDWDAYVAKWGRQLEKLVGIHAKGGTVIAPKLGTRLTGLVLAEYISQVEKRIEITKCLAKSLSSQ
ncbi:MAG: response regulator [Rhodospirillales bacterium]|nr:response regulator [Rhodospirillales bacterium]